MIAGCKHLMRPLLLYPMPSFKDRRPCIEELSSCRKAAYTGHHRRNDKKQSKGHRRERRREFGAPLLVCFYCVSACNQKVALAESLCLPKTQAGTLREAQKCFTKHCHADFATAVACLCFSVASRLIKMHHIELFSSMKGS